MSQADVRGRLGEVQSSIAAAKRKIEEAEAYIQAVLQEHERTVKRQRAELQVLQQEEQKLLGCLHKAAAGAAESPQGRDSAPAHRRGLQANGSALPTAHDNGTAVSSVDASGRRDVHDTAVSPMVAQFAQLLPGLHAAPIPAPLHSAARAASPTSGGVGTGGGSEGTQKGADCEAQQGQQLNSSAQAASLLAPAPVGSDVQDSRNGFLPRAVQLTQHAAAEQQEEPQQNRPARLPPGFGSKANGLPPGFHVPRMPPPSYEHQQPDQQQVTSSATRCPSPGFDAPATVEVDGSSTGHVASSGCGERVASQVASLSDPASHPAAGLGLSRCSSGQAMAVAEEAQPHDEQAHKQQSDGWPVLGPAGNRQRPWGRGAGGPVPAPKRRPRLRGESEADEPDRPLQPAALGAEASDAGRPEAAALPAPVPAGAAQATGAAASPAPNPGGYDALLEGQYVPPSAPSPTWSKGAASREDIFPALGAGGPSAAPATSSGPPSSAAGPAAAGPAAGGGAWGNKWAAGTLRDRLKQSAGPATSSDAFPTTLAPAPAAAPLAQAAAPPIEIVEQRCGLRVAGDGTPDLQRRRQVRKRTFAHTELVGRRPLNVAEGLELHEAVLSPAEQALLVEEVEGWVALGRAGGLRGRTFSAPRKWMPGKGRMTVQFGCCYNYAADDQGRQPGIVPEEIVEPMPPTLRALCRRLTRWHILPRATEPDSAIVNIYEEGDCIPPHIDHFDFVRPFCTISLVSEQPIMFSKKLVARGPGDFWAPEGGEPALIPLPTGSCLVLKGYGGEKAEHCVPPVASRRISITLRCMAPKYRAAVQREIKRHEEAQGPLRPFWGEDGPKRPTAGSYVTIK
ncbi:hypothetical protein N2152v2_005244 [Parachlorella kessleri]